MKALIRLRGKKSLGAGNKRLLRLVSIVISWESQYQLTVDMSGVNGDAENLAVFLNPVTRKDFKGKHCSDPALTQGKLRLQIHNFQQLSLGLRIQPYGLFGQLLQASPSTSP